MRSIVILAVWAGFFCLANGSRVRKCGTEKSPEEDDNIHLSACSKLPCKLVRGNKVDVEMKFTPEEDIPKLVNSVHAKILGVPFPFIGVDGNSVCDKLFDSTGNKVGCPLKAGQQYVYKDAFDVLEIYPKIKVWVNWALVGEDNKQLCFDVPVRIV